MIKKIFAGAGILAVAGAAGSYGLSEYFLRRTLMRQNAKTERTMKMSGTDWDKYMPMMQERGKWIEENTTKEDVYITSRDGLKLHAYYTPIGDESKTVICFHGYTSSGSDFKAISKFYAKKGYSLLCPDARAHGESEGEYIGFGCLDRFDGLEWIEYIKKRLGENTEILLTGTSMGGATVLMMSGLDLPENVKGIISDCAFTSAWDVFSWVLKTMYHISPFPIMNISDRLCKKRAGYGLKECNSAEEVKKAKVPILFIHGSADNFVPSFMCDEIYENCASPKDKLIIEGASHAESYYKDPERYEAKITEFTESLK
ncbi:MAG: alpha/beta hydrolase [Oscillospiraceae bacterium]|nr:alpha/beta hydrolase [Oscillospiraceae bacterium]